MCGCYPSGVQRITSRQNALVKVFRDVARGDASGRMLLEGLHLVGEGLAGGLRVEHLLVSDAAASRPDVVHLLRDAGARHVPVAFVSESVMDAASPVRSASGVLALASRPSLSESPYGSADALVLIICDMQNPGNVGAIVRVAEAAGVSGVVIAGQSADPFGWKTLRGSMGSALRVPMTLAASTREAVHAARAHGASVIATIPREGAAPDAAPLRGSVALLIGGEGPGLPADIVHDADHRVSIPMHAPVESLNAAVAAAIVLYEARRQRASG